jgi:hypothetical protein
MDASAKEELFNRGEPVMGGALRGGQMNSEALRLPGGRRVRRELLKTGGNKTECVRCVDGEPKESLKRLRGLRAVHGYFLPERPDCHF